MFRVFNSLTRKVETFKPKNDHEVKMYTCGPTVYNFITIGNWRTYTLGDLLNRTLKYIGYEVDYVMNITDVGHLTGDNLGDADTGDDRLEKAAKKERKTAWEIADFYTKDFLKGYAELNLLPPRVFCKATDHIKEQIALVERIVKKDYTYIINDGVYFDTKRYEKDGNIYGELSNLDRIKKGARVEPNPNKKDPRDFALWKFSPLNEKRDMEWNSPWGKGFPGWHIECSAMSMKYLGNQLDVHLGGEDLKSTHHPNEIVQSETATGVKPFVRYWVHGAFLLVNGGRMGKSIGNAYTLTDIKDKDFMPMHLRYFYLTGHYSRQLNFTWEALEASKTAYEKLVRLVQIWTEDLPQTNLIEGQKDESFTQRFQETLEDDLNMPEALAVLWDLTKSKLSSLVKLATISNFDKVLGLRLFESRRKFQEKEIPPEAKALLKEREVARLNKDWNRADMIRSKLLKDLGLRVKDTQKGQIIL